MGKAVRMKKVKNLVPLFMPYVKRIFGKSDHRVCLCNIRMVFERRPTVRIIFSKMLSLYTKWLTNILFIYYLFIYLLVYVYIYLFIIYLFIRCFFDAMFRRSPDTAVTSTALQYRNSNMQLDGRKRTIFTLKYASIYLEVLCFGLAILTFNTYLLTNRHWKTRPGACSLIMTC